MYLSPADRERIIRPVHMCDTCGVSVCRNYCRSCDEIFFECKCPKESDVHRSHSTYKVFYSMKIYIWWLNQGHVLSVCRSLDNDDMPSPLPAYIQRQVESMNGRPLRGRLWVDNDLGTVEVNPWPGTSLGRELGANWGGVAFRETDLAMVKREPGIITDLNLNIL